MSENNIEKDLEERVRVLEEKVEILESKMSFIKRKTSSEPNQVVSSGPQPQLNNVAEIRPQVVNSRPQRQSNQVVGSNNVQRSDTTLRVKEETKVDKSGEAVIGKYIIGVLASILIFIAAVSLVGLIWTFLTPAMKCGIITVSGLVLTVLGAFLTKKYKNPVTAIILGTGEGLIFISILSANMFFNFIGSITSIVLVCIWSVLFMLSYKFTKMFFTTVIAYIGSFIALLMGLGLVYSGLEFVVLSLFVTGIVAVLLITSNKWLNNKKQIVSILLSLLIYTVLIIGGLILNGTRIESLKMILIIVFFIEYVLLHYLYKKIDTEKCIPWYLVVNFVISILTIVFLGNIYSIWHETVKIYTYFLLINILQMIVLEIETRYIRRINMIYYTVISVISLMILNIEMFNLPTGLICISIVLLLLQSIKKHKEYTKIALVVLLLDAVLQFVVAMNRPESILMCLLLGVTQTGLITYILYKNYKESIKKDFVFNKIVGLIVYSVNSICIPFLLVSMFKPDDLLESYKYFDIGSIIGYLCFSILLVFINISGYFRNWYNSDFKWFSKNESIERDLTERVFYVFTFIAYFIGLTLLVDADVWYNQLVMILSVLIVALLQTKTLVEHYQGYKIVGVWVGVKYLILTWVILGSVFNVSFSSVLISVSGLIIALLSIACGFKLQIKSLRLYGLILTIIMVIKFILVDLSQENSIMRVVSLLIGGLICFGITILYNRLNKGTEK